MPGIVSEDKNKSNEHGANYSNLGFTLTVCDNDLDSNRPNHLCCLFGGFLLKKIKIDIICLYPCYDLLYSVLS